MTYQLTVFSNLKIYGQFEAGGFPEWISHRAKRLNLSGWVKLHHSQMIEIGVAGNPILVDALEAACNLGPYEAKVDRVQVQDGKPFKPLNGFEIV